MRRVEGAAGDDGSGGRYTSTRERDKRKRERDERERERIERDANKGHAPRGSPDLVS